MAAVGSKKASEARAEWARNAPRDEKGRIAAREIAPEELKLLKKAEAKRLARYHLPTAIRIMADLMMDSTVRADIRLAAANAIADRAEGKPRAATIDVEGPALRIVVGASAGKGGKKD